jgi:hypothetical protein
MRALLCLLLCGSASAQSFSVESGSVTYHVVHKLHRVDGVSKKVVGKAILKDGKLQAAVRVPADSFDSGNVNRDAHQKEAMEAARYPVVELKVIGDVPPPAHFPVTQKLQLQAQVSLHGTEQLLPVAVEIAWESPLRARVTTHFAVSLDKFHVERPSLMFVKVDDPLEIDATLLFASALH